jgi:uncharacterized protein (DUF1800 family)
MLDALPVPSWSIHHAAHLLNRAGFGGAPDEVRAFYAKGLDAAVKSLIEGREDSDAFSAPAWAVPRDLAEARREMDAAPSDEARQKMQREMRMEFRGNMRDLREWWLGRMRNGTWPLREKMALFWHGHFATSIEKVREPYWMYVQNQTFRAHALGSFRSLVKAMIRDPAMLRWLDLDKSNAQHPNENFARELMELFTLGEGNYTEADIRESARAFTGYRFNPRTQQFVFAFRQHDNGEKTFMGRKGNFDGNGIVDILFEHPQTAPFIARKLWIYFASENPSPELVEALAGNLRGNDFHVGKFLSTLFRSGVFYAPETYRAQVKSPVQWLIQTSGSLGIPLPEAAVTDAALRQMGQVLFAPPNVKGWEGNRAWISTSTLLFRYNLAGYLVSERTSLPGVMKGENVIRIPLEEIAPLEIRDDDEKLISALEFRIFNARLPAKERAACLIYAQQFRAQMSDARIRDLLLMMMSTPDFQLV